ncbi:winged helix-turn-helix domain-containing protein [Paenibacillus filicis]|uniref:Winged helix-turn-helix domain-containing protein n=1 Tax=Paenibacillus filicis TaxID=669464 RepID=A0ABU9DJ38_9BACL
MQGFRDIKQLIDDAEGLKEGVGCESPRRIVFISPFPARIRPLVMELMVRCYDLCVFHHENDPLLATIPSDLLVIDRSETASSQPLKISSNFNSVLLLVGDEEQALPSGSDQVQAALVWPCPIPEVLEKIGQMVGQHAALLEPDANQVRYQDITLDLKRFSVHKSGVRIELTKNEFNLLQILIAAKGAVLTRDEIINELCGVDYFGGSNFIDVHIKSLRHKLEVDRKRPKLILTVRGIGYRLSDE